MQDTKDKLTSVDLTNEEALLFIQFRKRQAFMELIESVGGFDIKNGVLKLNFNSHGGVSSVVIERTFRSELSPHLTD